MVSVMPSSATHATLPAAAEPVSFTLQSPPLRASITALSPDRFKLQLTMDRETYDQLEQLQDLLRHQNPSGDLAPILARALRELRERTLKQRFAQTSTSKKCKPREQTPPAQTSEQTPPAQPTEQTPTAQPSEPTSTSTTSTDAPHAAKSRYIPRAVLREVYARDGGQCTFTSSDGVRCSARGFLEVHHHKAYARGGRASVDKLKLTCRALNLLLAQRDFGRGFMQQKLAAAQKSKARRA
jgi:hypothetical protein